MSSTHRIRAGASVILSICAMVACGDDSQSEGSAPSGGAASADHQTTPNPTSDSTPHDPAKGGSADPSGDVGQEPTATNQVLIGASFHGFPGHDFGRVTVGSRTTKRLVAFNASSGRVKIVELGTDSPQFQITQDACAGKELANREECSFSVSFEPDRTGQLGGVVWMKLEPDNVVGSRTLVGVGATGGPEPTETSESTTGPTSPAEDTPTTSRGT